VLTKITIVTLSQSNYLLIRFCKIKYYKMIDINKTSKKAPDGFTKKQTKRELIEMTRRIGDLQHIMYAGGHHNILVVLQGMDASGKDGTIKNVFRYCNPSGIDVYSFKRPTSIEMSHDFLWRVHKAAPRKGNIMVFNRSHYEDILIQRVHKWINEEQVKLRMDAINAFEKLLMFDNHTTIIKFCLDISFEEQGKKLQDRIDNPLNNWKHEQNDWNEREHWDDYMKCYNDAINWSEIPWNIVPADQKWYRNYIIAKKVLEQLESLPLSLPGLKN
jgi:PPK2 family polyphosphate:nucleotide phosphotransferase